MLNPLAQSTRYHFLTVALGTDELPTEFRLFTVGDVENLNGTPVTFDATAASAVMQKYRASGTRVQIDLEHDSLVKSDAAVRPDMRDARGWCDLELRSGELWAVNVEWTPDGARRLKEKTQRYVSPAFTLDAEGRVNWLVNVALCARPATLGALPLVASQQPLDTNKIKRLNMDPELMKKALEVWKSEDPKAALELIGKLVESATGAGGEPDPVPPPEASTADTTDPKKPDEMLAAVQAATALVKQTTDALKALKDEVKVLTDEHAAADAVERASLVGKLVELRAESPATAYADDAKTELKPRLANEPIAELRARVAELAKSAPATTLKQPTTPVVVRTFSPAVLAKAAARGITPEQLAAQVDAAVRTI